MVHFTSMCHLWILATSRERCTCTNTGHLTTSQRLSVNVTHVLFTYQIETCHDYECLSNKPNRGNDMESAQLVSPTVHNYWRNCQIHQW